MPATAKWWDDVVSAKLLGLYPSEALARNKDELIANLIWGDRVHVLATSADGKFKQIEGRGLSGWVSASGLGGKPLLELYVIDVGQGDGLLIVTPEGHHVMIDGGDLRSRQNSGKNAADFIDWKFTRDYLRRADRSNAAKRVISLDALIASHCDQDHFGGLFDLLDRESPANRAEISAASVTTEACYHAGLSWWWKAPPAPGKDAGRSLGRKNGGKFTQLLGDRTSCEAAVANVANPDPDTVAGNWGKFVRAMTQTKRKDGNAAPIKRLSHRDEWLPGFSDSRAAGWRRACPFGVRWRQHQHERPFDRAADRLWRAAAAVDR
jgi:hypothetical protein